MYREDDGEGLVLPSDQHLVRTARAAGAKGSYFFKASAANHSVRPAVHLAEASTADEARQIHKRLWNQGVNPFLIILLPGEVRVYSGFAFHPDKPKAGEVLRRELDLASMGEIATILESFTSTSIDTGAIWRTQRKHLQPGKRVDTTLLAHLKSLSEVLQQKHKVKRQTSHYLIGRFVYLHFLRARRILSDPWLINEAGIQPKDVFSSDATKTAFRKLSKCVEATFNGKIFPIAWGSRHAPDAEAVNKVARVFAGDDVLSGQLHLPFTAYDFSFIPIELLSSIYEQFLHAEDPEASDKDGAHYTPEPLADYLVSEVDSICPLKPDMRILDPCCGSGVFLVVAFRRLVELECRQNGSTLSPQRLKQILQESIYAVERNETACQIAAFSLILAMLSYVDPPELHRLKKSFKFPSLIGRNLFPEDFFAPNGRFWNLKDPETREPLRFDWIIGNPPWTELDSSDEKAKPLLDWAKKEGKEFQLARSRPGEAFVWKAREKLSPKGVAGLILAAKTLTNDHLKPWRAKFFIDHQVHRITNLANLAYAIFPKVKEPAMTLIYSLPSSRNKQSAILHIGPFVANQVAIRHARKAWALALTESEIKSVPVAEAEKGDASTWKLALWGNHRDPRELARLKAVFPNTLGQLAAEKNWHLALGLQLSNSLGKKIKASNGELRDENEYVKELEGLPLLDHKALVDAGPCLDFTGMWSVKNHKGCYVRVRGGKKGVGLIRKPHLFLWNDYAAISTNDCIIEHDKIGLSAPRDQENWLRVISVLWTSSLTQYFLFFEHNAAWGIGRSQIDLGDAEAMRLPHLDETTVAKLAKLHKELADELVKGRIFDDKFRCSLDREVAKVLKLPVSLMRTATDFAIERLSLNQGVVPPSATTPPGPAELLKYATRLAVELDAFVGGKAHHRVTIRQASAGIVASVEITRQRSPILPKVVPAAGSEAAVVKRLLAAAEQQVCQWVYVKRSVRLVENDTIHLIKPPRRMEWTEARAALDADDIIAEVASRQGTTA
jgi:hypothetical protein